MIVGTMQNSCVFYKVDNDKINLISKLVVEKEEVQAIGFCNEKNLLATSGEDFKVKIWNLDLSKKEITSSLIYENASHSQLQ